MIVYYSSCVSGHAHEDSDLDLFSVYCENRQAYTKNAICNERWFIANINLYIFRKIYRKYFK